MGVASSVPQLMPPRSVDCSSKTGYHALNGDEGLRTRRFKWIEWNLQKIDSHALSAEEVETAFNRVFRLDKRKDGSYQMFAETSFGRRIWVI